MRFFKGAILVILLVSLAACGESDSNNGMASDNGGGNNGMQNIGGSNNGTSNNGQQRTPDTSGSNNGVATNNGVIACGLSHDTAMFADKCGGSENDQMLLQKMTNLSWVNGINGCHTKTNLQQNTDIMDGTVVGATKFCEDLDYGGHMDWRIPTQDEVSVMIIAAVADKVTLNYINPNCQAMITSDGFVQTEKTADPGKKIDNFGNFGIRCVRDLQ